MKYYVDEPDISEFDKQRQANAGSKARNDIRAILDSEEYTRITIPVDGSRINSRGKLAKFVSQIGPRKAWMSALSGLASGDALVVQFPTRGHSVFLGSVFDDLNKRGVRVILLIHDLELLRSYHIAGRLGRLRIKMEELPLLRGAHRIIAHNECMADALVSKFNVSRNRIVCLELFDYLADGDARGYAAGSDYVERSFVIAGNLSNQKAGYVYDLPKDVKFRLYGVGYDVSVAEENVAYCGVFEPDTGPNTILGDFGLVWDGPSAETCVGPYGEYLAVNNPHKVSLYLAAGMPVVIWGGAALADFVTTKGVGVVVSSLNELRDIASIDNERYYEMVDNAQRLSRGIRRGDFMRTALFRCIEV